MIKRLFRIKPHRTNLGYLGKHQSKAKEALAAIISNSRIAVPEGIQAGFEQNAGISARVAPAISDLPAKPYQDPLLHDVTWWNRFGAGLAEKLTAGTPRPPRLAKVENAAAAWQNWLDAAELSPKATEIRLTDRLGVRMVLTEKLVQHLRGEDLPKGDPARVNKQKQNRDRDYHAIVETIQNPDEIWLAPFGKVGNKLRQRYLRSFEKSNQLFVIERDESGHVAVTSFADKRREAHRLGYPVYKKNND